MMCFIISTISDVLSFTHFYSCNCLLMFQTVPILPYWWLLESYQTISVLYHKDGRYTWCLGYYI